MSNTDIQTLLLNNAQRSYIFCRN